MSCCVTLLCADSVCFCAPSYGLQLRCKCLPVKVSSSVLYADNPTSEIAPRHRSGLYFVLTPAAILFGSCQTAWIRRTSAAATCRIPHVDVQYISHLTMLSTGLGSLGLPGGILCIARGATIRNFDRTACWWYTNVTYIQSWTVGILSRE